MKVKRVKRVEFAGDYVRVTMDLDASIAKVEDIARRINNSRPEDSWVLAIQKEGPGRSALANAYYWVLIGKLAQSLHISIKEVHNKIVQDYGIVKLDENGYPITFVLPASVNPDTVCPYTRIVGRTEVDGVPCIQYAVLKGSSEMDSYEFSTLLEGLIYECEETGVDILIDIGVDEVKKGK